MKKILVLSIAVFVFTTGSVFADIFAEGTANEFTIDFVPISGGTNPASGYGIVNNNYRMGMYEITNGQWNKFRDAYGTVYGNPAYAYGLNQYWTGTDVPAHRVSWHEAAQFANWLNTSTGHQAAYKFTGRQGTSDYTLSVWDVTETDGTNLYRHKDAHYFLPTEDEWVKAAYWNGTNLQTWATIGDTSPTQTGWNYFDNGYATDPFGPWNVGSGSEELNGTFDMMGNVWEWMESPFFVGDYLSDSYRSGRGGSYNYYNYALSSSNRYTYEPVSQGFNLGFRVASIPEPATLVLLGMGGVLIRKRK